MVIQCLPSERQTQEIHHFAEAYLEHLRIYEARRAVIKKLVFEGKAISLNEFMSILRANFEGNGTLRQRLIGCCPKFGNDGNYVYSDQEGRE